MGKKSIIAAIILFLLLAGAMIWRQYLASKPEYITYSYGELDGWSDDQQAHALTAFKKSCAVFLSLLPETKIETKIKPEKLAGRAQNWRPSCQAAAELDQPTDRQARRFFEQHFTPVGYSDEAEGLFTGYFAPEYAGSLRPTAKYTYPLYGLPENLKTLDLGRFSSEFMGKSIIGEVVAGEFVPYKDREQIDKGALRARNLELVWLKDPVDAFFMHIQGSGVIRFENGARQMYGYAGKNGKAYHAIGKFLIQSGDLTSEDMSMQSIRHWIRENPLQAQDLMWKNPSYIFFRPLDGEVPVGSMNVPLTAGRSLAVDRDHVPLGLPVWLDLQPTTATADPIRRLMVAQDTGGAIKGRVRADIYWGIGADAGLMAGDMKDRGRYYFLLPKSLAQKITAESP